MESVLEQYEIVADKIKLDDGIRERLRYPKRALIVSVPIEMDTGIVKVFKDTGFNMISHWVHQKEEFVIIQM